MKILVLTTFVFILFNSIIESYNISLIRVSKTIASSKSRLEFAGKGYDIFKGNPKQKDFDSGFRGNIFRNTYNQDHTTSDHIFQIGDNLESNTLNSCKFSESSNEYTSMSEYQKGLNVEASLSVGFDNSIYAASFTASTEYHSVKNVIKNEQSILIESGGICQVYDLTLPLMIKFDLTENFKNYINSAFKKTDKSWINVIQNFGTHFTSKVTFGGRASSKYKLSARSVSELNQMSIDVRLAGQLSYLKMSGSVSAKTENSKKQIDAFNQKVSSKEEYFIGGKPNSNFNLDLWMSELRKNPMPIQYSLVPISSLFTSLYFSEYNEQELITIKNLFDNATKEYSKELACEIPSKESNEPLKLSARYVEDKIMFGSSDGYYFNDFSSVSSLNPTIKAKSIKIRNSSLINQIQIRLADDFNIFSKVLAEHGENRGSEYTFNIPENEYITQVEVRNGKNVDSLTFITNKNSKSKYGGNGGSYHIVNAPPDGQLFGIKGYAQKYLNSIGFIWMIPKYGESVQRPGTYFSSTIESPRITNWGTWGNWEECKNSHYAIGFISKVEPRQGGGDDTAMNGIYLYCSDFNQISSKIGPWGDWGKEVSYCGSAENPKRIKAFAIKVEKPDGDDTATNAIKFMCEDGQEISNLEGEWGVWSNWIYCPNDSYICGLSTQVEDPQKAGDDTALNNVQFSCCRSN